MSRYSLAHHAVTLCLMAAVAMVLIQWGGARHDRDEAREQRDAAYAELTAAQKAVDQAAGAAGEARDQQAQQCAAEGSDAFARGRAFGRAEACVLAGH